jgi:hypothetical protein
MFLSLLVDGATKQLPQKFNNQIRVQVLLLVAGAKTLRQPLLLCKVQVDGVRRLLREMNRQTLELQDGETQTIMKTMLEVQEVIGTLTTMMEGLTHLLDLRDHLMEEEVAEEEAEVEEVLQVVAENATNAIKKVTWLENVLILEMTKDHQEAVVEAVEPVSSANKKDTWLENALTHLLMVKEEVEEEVEAEEEIAMVEIVDQEVVSSVTRKATWLVNVQILEMMAMIDLTKGKEEMTMVEETLSEERMMITTTGELLNGIPLLMIRRGQIQLIQAMVLETNSKIKDGIILIMNNSQNGEVDGDSLKLRMLFVYFVNF